MVSLAKASAQTFTFRHPESFSTGSNRGHDSLTVFHDRSGETDFSTRFSTSSTLASFLATSSDRSWRETTLSCCNQNSDNIVSFWINEKDGTLTPTGRSVEVPSFSLIQNYDVVWPDWRPFPPELSRWLSEVVQSKSVLLIRRMIRSFIRKLSDNENVLRSCRKSWREVF